jgi:alpha-tubulin suppressor-like RCC1 family protein
MGAGGSAHNYQNVPLQPDSAREKKEQGNHHFQLERFSEAELAYSEAISLVNQYDSTETIAAPNNSPHTVATLWSNRSAARTHLSLFGEALSDALVAMSLRPRWYKAYWRAGQAAAALKQWQLAREYLLRAQILTNSADTTINALLNEAQTKRPIGLQDGPGSLMVWGKLPSKNNEQHVIQRPTVVNHLRGKFVTEVAAGAMHTLALTPHGVYAWGSNVQGQCGIGVAGRVQSSAASGNDATLPPQRASNCILFPQLIPSLLGVSIASISCGVGHSCAIDSKGVLWTWGLGGQGQLGLGEQFQCVPTPTAVLSLRNQKQRVRAVSCGIAHTFCVTTDVNTERKCLFSFGWNHCGQLGLGGLLLSDQLKSPTLQPPRLEDTVLAPTLVTVGEEKDNDPVQQVSCGGAHTVVVTRSGQMFVTGSGSCGQLGLDVGASVSASVGAGAGASAGASAGAFGGTSTSASHDNTNVGAISSFHKVPPNYFGGRKIAFVCAGEEFTCVVTKEDQEVFVCGLGNQGQLGDGKGNNQIRPTMVQGMSGKGTVSLVSGKTSTMALTSSGEIYVWGGRSEDDPYQGGDLCLQEEKGNETFRLPQRLPGIKKKRIRQLEIGRSHLCALLYATSPEYSHCIHPKRKKSYEMDDTEEQENSTDSTSTATTTPTLVVALGKRYKFQVQAMDDEGKTVGVGCDQFHILAVEEASGGLSFADALVDDNFDGTYSCSVRPKNIGIYSVQVKLFGIHVVGSPFDMEVVPVRVQLKEEEEKKKEEGTNPKDNVDMKKRRALMVVLKREEMTRRRAKEALLRVQRERKADEARELRRKKQKRCGGGFVVDYTVVDL